MNAHRLLTLSRKLVKSGQFKEFIKQNKVFTKNGLSQFMKEIIAKQDSQKYKFLPLFGRADTLILESKGFLEKNNLIYKSDFDKTFKKLLNTSLGKDALRLFSSREQSNESGEKGSSKDEDSKGENEPNNNQANPMAVFLLLALLAYMYLRRSGYPDSEQNSISWNDFYHNMLSKGEVESIILRPEVESIHVILHPNAIVKGEEIQNGIYTLKVPSYEKFEEKLRKAESELGISTENRVPITYQRGFDSASRLVNILIFLCLVMLLKDVKIGWSGTSQMFSRQRKFKFLRVDQLTKEGKGVTFRDVAGLHEAKIEVMEFVDYLKKSDNYKKLGAKIPRGALLLGPPGCGKTLLAKAVATEAKVPFLAMAGSEFVEMYGGLGAARVRELFKEARQNSPCIIYIDEIDAIGRKRSKGGKTESSEEEQTLNQLLVEMDGIDTKEGVIVMASTNRADVLDKALLRAGRFDRHILIDLPTLKERVELFDIYLKKLKLRQPPSCYSENLAQLSPGMSGADISNICNEAALHAARNGAAFVDGSNFDYAVERIVAGVAKKSRIMSQQEKKVVAYHEAGHALVGWLLEHTENLMKVSIVPRTNNILGFAQYLPQDKKLQSSAAMFEQMCLMLGGRVAESITFNAVTSGAQDDLKKVTKLAYDQVRVLGMNEKVGLVSFPDQSDFSIKPYSKATAKLIDQEVNLLVANVYKATEKLVTQNKEKLKAVAEALLEKEALSYRDLEQLIGPPPFAKKGFPGLGDKGTSADHPWQ